MIATAPHHSLCLRRCLVLLFVLLIFAGLHSVAAPAATSPDTGANNTLTTRDSNGNLLETHPNPESLIPLKGGKDAASSKSASSGSILTIVNNVLALGLILILAYVVILGLKKYQGQRYASSAPSGGGHPARLISILESASLGQGRSVHLVQVSGRCFLVGTTLQNISLLGEVTDDAEVQRLLAQAPAAGSPITQPFQQLLSRFYPAQAEGSATEKGDPR